MTPFGAELIAGTLFIAALALAAVKSGTIDVSGALLGALISLAAFLAGGVQWLIVIVAFFAISSLFTRFRYDYKRKLGSAQEKKGKRSWPNTLANGGVAAGAAIAELYLHQDLFAVIFLGAVTSAMSDTLATEIGLLSNSMPRLITNLKKTVSPGTSGGVSFLGEVTAFGTALGMGLLGITLSIIGKSSSADANLGVASVVIGAMVGTTLDSFLGATVQGVRKCDVCGGYTESDTHHGKEAALLRGSRRVDNNVVNFVAILAGALATAAVYLLL